MAKILVVDDEPDMLELQKRLLKESTAHDVVAASSPAEALDLGARTAFDLLITDFRMPGMDGVALARAMRARWPKMKAVLVTAFADSAIGTSARDEGVLDAILRKSAEPFELLDVVNRLLS